MIEFVSYASGSSGNLYVVTAGAEHPIKIMIECGLPMSEIAKLPFRLSDISACLVSHEHKDHSKSARQMALHGIDLYMTDGTAKAIGLKASEYHGLEFYCPVHLENGASIIAFPTHHDSAEPSGFMVISPESEVLVFAIDTYYMDFAFKRVDIAAVECNHSYEILKKRVADGELDKSVADRVAHSHMALENVIGWLDSCDLWKCREIWLLHMSDDNGDARVFADTVMSKTGIPVHVAERRWLK